MMIRINSITVSPLQQHRKALGAIGDRSHCRPPTAELMAKAGSDAGLLLISDWGGAYQIRMLTPDTDVNARYRC